MTKDLLAQEQAASSLLPSSSAPATASDLAHDTTNHRALLVLVWTVVAIPLAWGGWITLSKALAFFH